jgi:hypothetical protein
MDRTGEGPVLEIREEVSRQKADGRERLLMAELRVRRTWPGRSIGRRTDFDGYGYPPRPRARGGRALLRQLATHPLTEPEEAKQRAHLLAVAQSPTNSL